MQVLNSKSTYTILAGILVLAFFLRFHNIGEHGLAGDEKYSLFVSQFVAYEGNNQKNSVRKPDSPYFTPKEFWAEKTTADFFDSISRLDTGNGSLYTYSLHFWSNLTDIDDASLRFLSLIFNLFTVALIFIFVRTHLKSDTLALLAAFLAAISPFYINYSQVARNYALLYFFALLSTHLLLVIVEREKNNQKNTANYIYYGLAGLACELCHISAFPLFLIHGLYVLIYVRQLRAWVGLSLAMLIPVIGVIGWLKSPGGQWLFEYVTNSVKVYNYMARTSPDEYLSVATLPNILKQLRHVVSLSFISSEGLYVHLAGIKNTLIAILCPIAGLIGFFKLKSDKTRVIGISALLIACFFLYSVAGFHFLVLSLNLVLLGLLIGFLVRNTRQPEHSLIVFMSMLAFLPIVFLILFSMKDGNTFRIVPRYIGYSYAFGIVLMVFLLKQISLMKSAVKYILYLLLGIQLVFIGGIIRDIWNDTQPRYFMTYESPRKKNPYQVVANKIENLYAKGDTVIYCAYKDPAPGGLGKPEYSVVDAQLINFYLPKDSEIIQRVNPNEPDKIILKKADGREWFIFDFEGTKYRY